MKVGIVTFHRAINYGAVLQTVALSEYINEELCECEIIDYIPNSFIGKKRPCFISFLGKMKRIFFSLLKHGKKTKNEKFNDFITQNLKLSSKKYLGDSDIISNPPKYDVYISGSDQILNTSLTGDSTAFYLSFVSEGKKLSYASSFGRSEISNMEINFMNKYMVTFDAISGREESACANIKRYLKKDSVLVVDPVFLLDKEKWLRYLVKTSVPLSYVLVYAMEYSDIMKQTIERVQKAYNIPIVIISGNPESNSFNGIHIENLGPGEFLYVLKNAEIVVTNSFHGTAFSIIFEKPFYCVSHSTKNTRIENLLSLVNENDNLVSPNYNSVDVVKKIINGKRAYLNIQHSIDKSKQFIKDNLNNFK